jgi:hypothetical protein
MKQSYKKLMSGAAVVAACLTLAFAFSGCENTEDQMRGLAGLGGEGGGIITYSARASGSGSTAKINLNFDAAVSGLKADDITFDATPAGVATVGALTGSGKKWSLAVNVTADAAAAVSISKAGIEDGTKGVTLRRYPSNGITYTALADGGPATTSTKIDFEFDEDVQGLTIDDIMVGEMGALASKTGLTGSGKNWTLEITVTKAGAAGISVTKEGIDRGVQGITLCKSFIADASSPDLSIKFGITIAGTTTKQEVTDTFNAVHDYLATNPTVSGSGADTKIGGIALGDYIDLASLTIGTNAPISNTAITPSPLPFAGYEGRLLRLIVVGINSFKVANNIGVVNSSAPTHLVFQFQNLPATHSMNSGDTNVGGYAASGMKAYIMGDFLTGLKSATGLTDAMLWAPARNVSHGGNPVTATDTITDALWLPTEWEMSGARTWSSQDYEVGVGQARLEYYQADADRKKYDSGNTASRYRLASPRPGNNMYFCAVRDNGATNMDNGASSDECVAPAFCIK